MTGISLIKKTNKQPNLHITWGKKVKLGQAHVPVIAAVHKLYRDKLSFRVHLTDPHCLLLSLCPIDSSQKTDGGRLSHQPRGKLVLWSGLQSLNPSMSLAHRVRQNCADSHGCRVCCLFWSLSIFKLVLFGKLLLVMIITQAWVCKTFKQCCLTFLGQESTWPFKDENILSSKPTWPGHKVSDTITPLSAIYR